MENRNRNSATRRWKPNSRQYIQAVKNLIAAIQYTFLLVRKSVRILFPLILTLTSYFESQFLKIKRRVSNFQLRTPSFQLRMSSFFFICACFFQIPAHSQDLQSYLEQAIENSPEIQKFDLQYKRISEKVNEAKTIPNTEFGIGYFVSEPETRTGAQRFRVSIKQMLPWFGTITSRENYRSSIADATFEDIVIAKRKLITSVSQSYYNLYANNAKQKVFVENIKLLNTYEKLALTSVEVGKASVVDVLRLQMRQNEMSQLLAVLQQQYLAEQTTFNKLLNLDKKLTINVVEELEIPSDDFDINVNNLAVHPELLKYDKLYESVEKSELLNQKERNPMIGFGLDYINVSERPNMNFSDNGKDIIMPMVSVTIPIFNTSYKSQTKQNELQQKEILAEKQQRVNRLETLLDNAVNTRISAKISYQTQLKNLEQAKNAETILLKSYETGTIDFNDVLDVQELQLKFQINQIESVKNYYMQTTIINYLTK